MLQTPGPTIAELPQPTQLRDLAFLSVCETAVGSVRHLDEAIHVGAAMQFLGHRHIIATLWTIADSSAPQVADMVYATLTRSGRQSQAEAPKLSTRPSTPSADPAPTNPLLWAPYVQLGP